MKLEFELIPSYGKLRFYPTNALAQALVELTGRKCLRSEELRKLESAGFGICVMEKGTYLQFTEAKNENA